jgi:hypothetical protein
MTHNGPGISRRAALKGLGVTMALPWLEAMAGGGRAAAGVLSSSAGAGLRTASASPTRMAFVFAPNGVNYEAWAPAAAGRTWAASPTLAPIERVREHVNVITGLTLDKARANGDGPGDHARSSASFLTGAQARKTAGNDIQLGMSVDQFAARQIGGRTRLPSLELGCERGQPTGNCDSGYSCAYSSNISWADETTPVPKSVDPARVFERLFGDARSAAERADHLRRRASVLDFVLEDSKRLERQLGAADRRKLDGFQTSVREIERRVRRAQAEGDATPRPGVPAPAGIPEKFSEHLDLMFDMMLLAFRMDLTRVCTFAMANDGSNRTFPEIGIRDGHHHLSHHQNNQEMVEKIRLIDRFYLERYAAFVDRLAATPEGDGTLLDHCMVLYGCGISDGNRHNHEDLPILMAGRGGGSISTGRLVATRRETPLCNLYVSMLERAGCDVGSFGDSTGALDGLSV